MPSVSAGKEIGINTHALEHDLAGEIPAHQGEGGRDSHGLGDDDGGERDNEAVLQSFQHEGVLEGAAVPVERPAV